MPGLKEATYRELALKGAKYMALRLKEVTYRGLGLKEAKRLKSVWARRY